MKKLILFFTNPIIGGILSLIGILEILFSIPSSYLNYRISLWIIVLVIGFIILALYLYKKLRIVNGNLAVSNIRKLECSSFDFHSIAYGYGKFKEKIHFTEYYP